MWSGGSHHGVAEGRGRSSDAFKREALGVETLSSLEFETIDEPSIVTVKTQQEEVKIEPENA